MNKAEMNLGTPLFEGQLVYLAAINPDQDAEVESGWLLDGDFQRLLGADLVRPLSPTQIKREYVEIEKKVDQRGDQFYFTIRRLPAGEVGDTDLLLGFARLDGIAWSNGVGSLSLGIGDPAQRKKGFGTDALAILLRFAFRELNLFRVSASVPGNNQAALRLFEKTGFKGEARRREVYHRAGERWDEIYLGLLREEWEHHHG